MGRGRGWRAADRRAAAGARARDGGEGSLAAVAGAAEGECVRPSMPSLRSRCGSGTSGRGGGKRTRARRWGSRAYRGACGGVRWAMGAGGPCVVPGPSRGWGRPGPPRVRARGGPCGRGLWRGCGGGAESRPAPAGLGAAWESGGSSGKFWERPSGQQGRGVEPAGRRGSGGDVGSAWFRFYLATCSGVGNHLECAPHEAPQRENRRWVRSTAWAWLGLCEGKEKPLERGSSGRRAGGPTGEVQARNLQQEEMRI